MKKITEKYNPNKIEKIVQKFWKKFHIFKVEEKSSKKKYYCLSMIPYPSGNLHVGHIRNYTIGDIISRYQRLQQKNVLHPIGWDSFGLPAENAAIKNNLSPYEWTKKNIKYMKQQLKSLGISYDWDKEITTCDSSFYKWEQWLFIKLLKNKLIYKKKSLVNWCQNDKTVLANEQVINGKCWRCNSYVIYKHIPQWFIKTKKYTKELLNKLKHLNKWPLNVINMQKNWIGKSNGFEIYFRIQELKYSIKIYTQNFKLTNNIICISINRYHKLVYLIKLNNLKLYNLIIFNINNYLKNDENLGINTTINAIHPITKKLIPIWITNFTEKHYNTKAIIIYNNDKIYLNFIKKYNFKKKKILINKKTFLKWKKKKKILINKKIINFKTNFKLKDWVISRQRYWGVPIPILKTSNSIIPVKYSKLPVILPKNIKINLNNLNPLKKNKNWKFLIINKKKVKRETDTFDTFMETSWYYTRFISPKYKKNIFNIKKVNKWLPIDTYIGGIEHATMHLIYIRLIHKIMRDLGLIICNEPIKKLICQGLVLTKTFYYINEGKKNWVNFKNVKKVTKNKKIIFYEKKKKTKLIYAGIKKMSKSLNNGINPNSILNKYGADTLRLFIIFSAPVEKNIIWKEKGIIGCYKFLNRFWKLIWNFQNINFLNFKKKNNKNKEKQKKIKHYLYNTVLIVTKNIKKNYNLNVAISQIMKFIKHIYKYKIKNKNDFYFIKFCFNQILILIYPFAPHISFYLWKKINLNKIIIDKTIWPKLNDKKYLYKNIKINIAIQINGKTKKILLINNNLNKNEILQEIYKSKIIEKFIQNKSIKNIIHIKNKIINFVI